MTGNLVREDLPAASHLFVVSEKDGAVAARCRTDEQGAFSIAHLPPGFYRLLVNDRTVQRFRVALGMDSALGTIVVPSIDPGGMSRLQPR